MNAKAKLLNRLRELEISFEKPLIPANERCAEMLNRLQISKFCPVVTIAGTNGKGSSTFCLAAYAQTFGLKVGRFISPHLLYFNERIAVNNVSTPDEMLLKAFSKIDSARQDIHLGYTDYAFLAAILIFSHAQVDLMVLEVGLGGRLDAVNSLDADLAMITTIHFDHTHLLGNTREAIGFEKAGIFRSNQLAVCGDINPPCSIFEYAATLKTRLLARGRDFDLIKLGDHGWSCVTPFGHFENLPCPHFPLQNALTVLVAILMLAEAGLLPFDLQAFSATLSTLSISGRMQKIQEQPEIILDVAHNPESVAYLSDYLVKLPKAEYCVAIFTALKDKDVLKMIQSIQNTFQAWKVLELDHPRKMSKEKLSSMIQHYNANAEIKAFSSIETLMDSFISEENTPDRIIVFGSFFLADQFLKWYDEKSKYWSMLWHLRDLTGLS